MDFKLSEVLPNNPFGDWNTIFAEEKPKKK